MSDPKDPLSYWPQFVATTEARMRVGRQEYGDVSFSRNPEALITEIEEELADVCGWSFVLFARLQRLREALRASALSLPSEPVNQPSNRRL